MVFQASKWSDTVISALSRFVKAMGGSLSLVAEFPERKLVVISGIGEIEEDLRQKRHHVTRI
jgi:hypothetical protein